MNGYIWPTVFSALAGAAFGAFNGYTNAHWLVNKANSYIVIGIVVLCIPFTVYFSIEKNPILTLAVYFIPAFGIVYVWISSAVIENFRNEEAAAHYNFVAQTRRKKEAVQEEMSLDDLLAEKARRDAARGFESHITELSDEALDEVIKAARKKNQ